MLFFYYTKETPKLYIMKQKFFDARETSTLIVSNKNKFMNVNDLDQSVSNTTSDQLSEFRVSMYDYNYGGRDYASLTKPMYYRAFLVG
mmetsp:Transcript_9537/g.10790  ORF Transcript_9537/g.10790 Transcript_9537/m.10790 type:complete len:88 (+) Transcript_9537:560-823(+)